MDSKNNNQQQLLHSQSQDHGILYETADYPPPRYGEYQQARSLESQDDRLSEQQETGVLEQALRWIPLQPVAEQGRYPVQMKPVVIPRIDTNSKLQISLPFLRAYSPDLHLHNVNERDFVAFIDNLSIVQAAPAPLQAIGIAGKAVGFVPNHWFQLAGFGVEVAAGVGTAAITTARTRRFIQMVNQEYFAPRGVKASLVKNKDLAEKLGYDENLPQLAPIDVQSNSNSLRDRRLKALEPYIASLSFDVSPPTQQRSILDQISAKQIEQTIKKKADKEEKIRRKAFHTQTSVERLQQQHSQLHPQTSSESTYLSDSSLSTISNASSVSDLNEKFAKLDREIVMINAKAGREVFKDPKKAAKASHERQKEIQKIEEKREKLNRKREKKVHTRYSKMEAKQAKRDHKLEKKAFKGEEKDEKRKRKDEKKVDRMEFILIETL